MTWRVSIRAAAEADLRQAQEWYEGQSPGLGGEFLLCVADALTRLEQSPERFPLYYRGFRRVLTQRFPYKLFYRIEGDAVIVFRILHAARDHTRQLE
ncbi:MAG TPA: type II toxin-antitoxin system RelE/ParE family toxin [Candidatus Acidoferrum sp.]|nr:type II toxin-antitoxin system RelE/ParE family toxin [Candidatus Acidoferrum sp.]